MRNALKAFATGSVALLAACSSGMQTDTVGQPAPGAMSNAEIMDIALTANSGEMQQATLALQKSSSEEVRIFAHNMLVDHMMFAHSGVTGQAAPFATLAPTTTQTGSVGSITPGNGNIGSSLAGGLNTTNAKAQLDADVPELHAEDGTISGATSAVTPRPDQTMDAHAADAVVAYFPTGNSPFVVQLGQTNQQTLESLSARSGADFDRAYIDAQVANHEWLLHTLESSLIPSASSSAVRAQLDEMRDAVVLHLVKAKSIQQRLK